MKTQIKQRIEKLKNEIKDLELEWEKFDSTGMATKQEAIVKKMLEKVDEIKGLEWLLNFIGE